MPILGQKQCFLGSGGQFDAPHPILHVLDSKKYVLQDWRAGKWVMQRPPPRKMAIFCPKMVIFCPKMA